MRNFVFMVAKEGVRDLNSKLKTRENRERKERKACVCAYAREREGNKLSFWSTFIIIHKQMYNFSVF